MESFLLPWVATEVFLLAVGCLLGATLRGQPWTSAVTLPPERHGLRVRGWRCCRCFARPLCVATGTVNYCAAWCSI